MPSSAPASVADRTPAPLDSSLGSYAPPGSAPGFVDPPGGSFARESQNLVAPVLESIRMECEPQNGSD